MDAGGARRPNPRCPGNHPSTQTFSGKIAPCVVSRSSRDPARRTHTPPSTDNATADQFAPPPTEQVTYERRGSDWVVSSGYRGDRIFYRRAMVACRGKKWRHIEFEYPASEKRYFDNFVTRTSFALRAYRDVGCAP